LSLGEITGAFKNNTNKRTIDLQKVALFKEKGMHFSSSNLG